MRGGKTEIYSLLLDNRIKKRERGLRTQLERDDVSIEMLQLICELIEIYSAEKPAGCHRNSVLVKNQEKVRFLSEILLMKALKLAECYIKKDLILEIATNTKKNDSSLSSLREELKWLVDLFVALEEAVEDERKNQISKKLAELRGIKLPSEQRTVMAKNPHLLLRIKRGGYHQNEDEKTSLRNHVRSATI